MLSFLMFYIYYVYFVLKVWVWSEWTRWTDCWKANGTQTFIATANCVRKRTRMCNASKPKVVKPAGEKTRDAEEVAKCKK